MSDQPLMQVHCRYFAALREQVGCEQETLAFPVATTIGAAQAALLARHPTPAPILERCVAACNRTFADDATVLVDGDELVFIPPMAGGGDSCGKW